jgi:cytochrome o ubiquinol oxidase subunit 1
MATHTPIPEYNFAVIPEVTERDAFWEMKKNPSSEKPAYKDIWVPKNSGMGAIIGLFALGFGIAAVWHIWWLLLLSLFAVIVLIIIKLTDDDVDKKLTAEEIAEEEEKLIAKELKEQVA